MKKVNKQNANPYGILQIAFPCELLRPNFTMEDYYEASLEERKTMLDMTEDKWQQIYEERKRIREKPITGIINFSGN